MGTLKGLAIMVILGKMQELAQAVISAILPLQIITPYMQSEETGQFLKQQTPVKHGKI